MAFQGLEERMLGDGSDESSELFFRNGHNDISRIDNLVTAERAAGLSAQILEAWNANPELFDGIDIRNLALGISLGRSALNGVVEPAVLVRVVERLP